MDSNEVSEANRMAEIGRAVVAIAFPGNEQAAREANAERVVSWLNWKLDELRALESSDALYAGRLVISLSKVLNVRREG